MGHQNRRHWRFWLNLTDPQQEELNRFCEWAVEQKKLAQFIRDALRLVGTLQQGRVDVLLEMFPFVQQALAPEVKSAGSNDSGDTGRRLERIEQLLLENSQGTAYQMSGPKSVTLKKVSAASFDDDLDTLVLEKSTAVVDVKSNFLSALGGLLGEEFQ